MHLLLFAVASR